MNMTAPKRRICFFCGDITRSGGTERVSINIADKLNETGKYEVIILSIVEQSDEPFFDIPTGIARYRLDERKNWINPGPGYLPLVPKLRRFLKEQKISVIIDIDIILDVLSIPASSGLDVKVIAWEHFNLHVQWPSRFYRAFRKAEAFFTAKAADCVVTLTDRSNEDFRQLLKRKKKTVAIYNPIESRVRDLKSRIDVSERENMLITVGRLIPRKGMDMLAELAPVILGKHSDWKWYILGEGEDRVILEKTISEHHLEDRLILTGNVKNVDDYLARASIYVMTSRAEGLPLVLLEALENGVPCVSFDIMTGPREIISDGINGFLVEPFRIDTMQEKIRQLIEDPGLRRRFSDNIPQTLRKFEMETIIGKWEQLLDEI